MRGRGLTRGRTGRALYSVLQRPTGSLYRACRLLAPRTPLRHFRPSKLPRLLSINVQKHYKLKSREAR